MSASVPVIRSGRVEEIAPTVEAALRAESRVRLATISLILYLLAQGLYGVTWDIQWHGSIGRDSFWTPPHIFIYSSTGIAGLICLAAVLWETRRFRKGDPAVTRDNTTGFLLFRAPLAFYVIGVGMAIMVLAAPFDNYWHELYGIDASLWSPFHVMGMIGSFIGALGVIYGFASEFNRARIERRQLRLGLGWPGVGMILGFFGMLGLALINVLSAGYTERLWGIGPITLANWPLIMAAAVPLTLVGGLVATGRAGVATAIGTIYTLWLLIFSNSVVPLVDLVVHLQNLSYRAQEGRQYSYIEYVSPLLIPFVGLIIDAAWQLTRHRPQWRVGALVLASALGVGALVLAERPWMINLIVTTTYPDYWPIFWTTLPFVLLLAAFSGWAGTWWGRLVRSITG